MQPWDAVGNVVTYVAGVGAVAGAGYYAKRQRSVKAHMRAQTTDIKEMKAAFLGAQPTPLNPNPPRGIIAAITAQEKAMKEMKATLAEVTADTAEIKAEFRENHGSSAKDDLKAIRGEQAKTRAEQVGVKAEVTEVKKQSDTFHAEVTGKFAEVHNALGEMSHLVVTLTNRVVDLTEKVKVGTNTIQMVDAKITEAGPVHGIGDTVAEIRDVQKEQIEKEAG